MAINIVEITRFDGGKAQSLRWTPGFHQPFNQHYTAKHFDIRTDPKRLTPLVNMVDDSAGAANNNLRSFVRLEYTPGTKNIFGLGNVTGNAHFQILEKVTPDDPTSSWTNPTSGAGGSGSVIYNTLIGFLGAHFLMSTNSTNIDVTKYVRSTTTQTTPGSIVNGVSTYTGTVYPRPYYHTKDTNLYFGAYNKLAKYDGTTFTDISNTTGLTVPADKMITSLDEYGNYLAIATKDVNYIGNSRMYLWNRDTSLTTFDENVDMGDGALQIIGNIDGTIIGISEVGSTLYRNNPRIVIRSYSGGEPVIEKEITGLNPSINSLLNFKAKSNNQLYFAANLSTGYTIYVVGKNSQGQIYVTEANQPNNDTAVSIINGFDVLGDLVYAQYDSSGALNRTNTSATYTATSIYESTLNPNMPEDDKFKSKSLIAIEVMFVPLTTGQQVVIDYAVDGGAYTTIRTRVYAATPLNNETSNSFEATKDATGTSFTLGREYQFRIKSTGGAQITGFKYKYQTLDTTI